MLGVSAIETSVAGVTVNVVEPLRPSELAVITAVPAVTPIVRPPLATTVATAGLAEVKLAIDVISRELPSENVPVAMSCCVMPMATVGLTGVTAMERKFAGATVSVAVPVLPL